MTQQRATLLNVERTLPDFSEKVRTEVKELRIVFNRHMGEGVDVMFGMLPMKEIYWETDNRTLVITLMRHLAASKIYELTLGGDGNIKDVAGNPLAEQHLTFTTVGPEPVTAATDALSSTSSDIAFIHLTESEPFDMSEQLRQVPARKRLVRVAANPTAGFHYPYYLFIPQGIDASKPMHILVEPCNTGVVTDDFEVHDIQTKQLAEASHATYIAERLKVPLLVPVFPRPGGEKWYLYTHALDRDTLLITKGKLRRIDVQLIQMIAHAQRLLKRSGIAVKPRVFMNGFSASATFANRFAICHPTVVRAIATGGINSIPTFPTHEWLNTPLPYPVGIADVKAIADIEFDAAAYRQVWQYLYMGALDNNDTVPFRDAYDEADAALIKRLIGEKMMPARWHTSQAIYEALEIPAQFVTYDYTGHEIRTKILDDIVAFFTANAGNAHVEIVPHRYSIEEA